MQLHRRLYMSSIYGYTELAYALADATNRELSVRMAEDLLYRSWQMGGWNGLTQTAAEYGVEAVVDATGTPIWWTTEAIAGASEGAAEITYNLATEAAIDSVTHEVVVKEVAQKATQSGLKTLLKGGVSHAVKALPIVGAIATGIGLGWESYKEHPEAWTDLSEAIFGNSDDNFIEVLARIHAGGYTTAVREEHFAKICKAMAALGCFDYREYESTLDHTGVQPVTWTSVPAMGVASSAAISYGLSLYPGGTCVQTISDMLRGQTLESYAYIATNLPDTLNISTDTDFSGRTVYCYGGLEVAVVHAYYDTITEQYSYNVQPGAAMTIYSGQFNWNAAGDLYDIGGLCCNITVVEGDNDLFPNDHGSGTLSIAPTSTISQIIQAIKDQFPAWYDDSWLQPEYNPETGNVEDKRYYPITVPWWNYNDQGRDPVYTPTVARDGDIYPESDPRSKPQAEEITEPRTDVDDPYLPPVVPPGPTPPYVPIDDDSGLGLWAVYNPTLSELNDLGAYLWSSNIIDILQKFLQNPMDAIISLHKIFATPTTGTKQEIVLGYLGSGVDAKTVTKQFIEVNCGSVTVPEYFSDARDYDIPYTEVECYLPFIGIVRLKTADIIGGKVNIRYSIDTYSGACLCKIYVTKLGAKQLLYNFSSNCSMQIPLTGSDRTRLLSGAVAGAVAGAAVGGPVGAVAGAVGGAWKGGTSIERTSGFSANAGCMGVKKPYLIITRKYAYDAGNYNHFYGYPSNNTVTLSSCKGFTRVKSAHIENIGRATDSEKAEIESLLKQGVIIK